MDRGIPRSLYLLRVLWLCFFPLATVVGGNVFLLAVPQAQEALLAFGDGRGTAFQTPALYLAHLYWIGLAWFTARLLLDRRFVPDTLGLCRSPRFARRLGRYLPRALALLGGAPLGLYFCGVGHLWRGAGLLALTAVYFWFTVRRRAWKRRATGRVRALLTRERVVSGVDHYARFDRLAPLARWVVAAAFAISTLVFFGVWWGRAPFARELGSPALVLVALGSWTLFGGLVLTYLPRSRHRMSLTWLPLALLLGFAGLNENHPVAPPDPAAPAAQPPRAHLGAAFRAWLAARPDATRPIYLVASAGGASRAAYWSGTALGMLEDETRGHAGLPPFSRDIFMISGISGGSFGAASYVAALDATARRPELGDVRGLVAAFTGRDDLATAVGYALYPDMVQRLLPFPVRSMDRSLALEQTWTEDWAALAGPAANPWGEAFAALHARNPTQLPALVLNTTALARGLRVYQSDLVIAGDDGVDLFDPKLGLAVAPLTLAQAVHDSARFPYISPAGVVAEAGGKAVWDRLGDGGYVESSGARTLLDVLRELRVRGLVRDCATDRRCADPAGREGRDWVDATQLRVVLLFNAPAAPPDWWCGDGATPPRAPTDAQPRPLWFADLTAPPHGLLASYGRGADTATLELIRAVGGCARVAELRLPAAAGTRPPSMNWMLDKDSRGFIDAALDGRLPNCPPAAVPLAANLARLRGWIGLPTPATAASCK